MEQSRSERKQRALEQIKELEIAVEEKRRQVDETLAEASLQANKEKNNIETLHKNERSEARRRRLEKWMNLIPPTCKACSPLEKTTELWRISSFEPVLTPLPARNFNSASVALPL